MFPDKVSQEEYFAAASGGLFRDPRLTATLSSVDTLLRLLAAPGNFELRTCNYFMYASPSRNQICVTTEHVRGHGGATVGRNLARQARV